MKKLGEYLFRGPWTVFAALPLKIHYFSARILAWLPEQDIRKQPENYLWSHHRWA